MKKIQIKTIGFILLNTLFYANAMAQEDDFIETQEDDFIEIDQNGEITDTVNLLRLKKIYNLGDGLTLVSQNTQINFKQSLQLLYILNTTDEFETMNSHFRVRRARFRMTGTLFDKLIYFRVRLNFASNYQSVTSGGRSFNNVLQDAYAEYRSPHGKHRLNFGLRADFIDSREIRFEGEVLGLIERSMVSSAYDAIFDYGIRYQGQFTVKNNHIVKTYLSITSGDGNASLQKNYGGFKYGARLDYFPFGKFSGGGEFYMEDLYREKRPKLVIGGVYSYNVGTTSAKGTNGGRYVYGDSNKDELLPDYDKFTIEYLFKYKGFYSMASFVKTRAYIPDGIAGEFSLSGNWSPYSGTPEEIKNTVMGRLNVGDGFNIQAGYVLPSNWSFGARYSYLNPKENASNFAAQDKSYAIITTKYFRGNNLKIQAEIDYEKNRILEEPDGTKGILFGRLMLTLQL